MPRRSGWAASRVTSPAICTIANECIERLQVIGGTVDSFYCKNMTKKARKSKSQDWEPWEKFDYINLKIQIHIDWNPKF